MNAAETAGNKSWKAWLLFFAALVLVLAAMFHRSFESGVVHFANDFPVGNAMAAQYQMPEGLTGYWVDLNWLGQGGGAAPPSLNTLLQVVLGPIGYAKFLQPAVSMILGLCAWVFFRQAGLGAAASGLGGLAAALNMNFLSNACWGLGTRSLMLAGVFLALAALVSTSIRHWWLRALLAGGGIGLAIMEGYDNGAIFSIYVGIFALFLAWVDGEKSAPPARAARGIALVALMAVFSAVVAYQAIQSVVGTSITGTTLAAEEQMSPEQKWDWATQWSTPKMESLRVVIPGLFGYRMDATVQGEKGGEYWGSTGQQPGWEQHRQGFPRHSGSGEYAGVLVVLVSVWAVFMAIPRGQTLYTPRDRGIILFWAVAGLLSLLFAWGRHAPFYQLLYALPYFNTIRNPMKFMHAVHLALMILCAYGFDGLWRRYLTSGSAAGAGLFGSLSKLWAESKGPERSWLLGSIGGAILALFGVMIYSAGENGLVQHLQNVGFPPEYAAPIAKFSTNEAFVFLGWLVGSLLLIAAIMSGWFSGPRAKWGFAAAALVMVLDLGRANAHYIVHYRYAERYASNPVLEFMAKAAPESRISTTLPFGFPDPFSTLMQVYQIEWAQHQFPFYNIPSVDVVQMPREPVDFALFRGASGPFAYTNASTQMRYWELTSTRYLLSVRGAAGALNDGLDAQRKRFREAYTFEVAQPSPGVITAATNPAGPFSIVEFTGALPRAAVFTSWQVQGDDKAAIQTLASPQFDPHRTVLVSAGVPSAPAAEAAAPAVPAEWVSYSPKRFTLKARAGSPAILLVNDRYDPQWRVTVDGQPAELLRCNFLMRGVALTPGEHTVEFRYTVDLTSLYVSAAGIGVSLLLCGWVVLTSRRKPAASNSAPAK